MPYISYDIADKIYNLWNNARYILIVILIFAIIMGIYIHMRRKIIVTLKAKNRELEDANAAKSTFLSRMSHITMSLESGMNEHLAKPVDAAMIHEKIIQYTR